MADVAVITNITEDHLGIDDVNDIEQLAFVKALVGEAVKEDGYVVVNADDNWSKNILSRFKAKKIFFSKDSDNPLIVENIKSGGISIYVKDDILTVMNNNREYKLLNINNIPISLNGVLDYNLENAMAACAALVGLEIDYCMIAKGFKSFKLNDSCNAGRFNIYDIDGVRVILDYGHNIDGYKRVLKALSNIDIKNNLIGVIGVPGDRTNKMMKDIGKLCGESMDMIIIKEDKDRRGRDVNEVAKLIEEGVKESNCKDYGVILDEVEALRKSLSLSVIGDTIIVFYEELEPLVELIKEYKHEEENLNLANL